MWSPQAHCSKLPKISLAFTTIAGSGATDATSYIGSAGIDTLLLQNEDSTVFVGARASNDTVTVQNFTALQSGVTVKGGRGNDLLNTAGNTNLSTSFYNGNKNNDSITLGTITSSTIYGGQANDTLTIATVSASKVNGNKNTDVLNITNATGASLYGGQGTDTVTVTTVGQSLVQGDLDNDTINLNGTISNSTLNGNGGNDSININAGVTTFATSTIYGGGGNDVIAVAGVAQNGGVNLIVNGDNGNDNITTAAGDDVVSGGAGTDTLIGNAGSDTISGGTEADTFQIGTNLIDSATNAINADTISDFAVAQTDTITGLSVANVQLQAGVVSLNEVQDTTTALTGGTAVVTATIALAGAGGGSVDLGGITANTNVGLIAANYGSDAALQTAIRARYSTNGASLATDAFLAVYDNGTNSFLVQVTSGVAANNALLANATVQRLATISGVGDATTLTAASGSWGAFVA
jgi:Ca2+-binding RTX toxin-like protein